MKISTRGRYGARLMLDLANNYGKGPILLKDIASRQEISEKYLWQLISPLKNSGLVNSTRGSHGGYELAKSPKEINLKEIIEVLEGPITLVECLDNNDLCNRYRKCITKDIWDEVSIIISKTLEAISLAEMVERFKQKHEALSYYI